MTESGDNRASQAVSRHVGRPRTSEPRLKHAQMPGLHFRVHLYYFLQKVLRILQRDVPVLLRRISVALGIKQLEGANQFRSGVLGL
jgi:hypothetical protein